MEKFILAAYALPLVLVLALSLVQLDLVIAYLRHQRRRKTAPTPTLAGTWPRVTIQLPVYNELYVVERLLDSIKALRYPPDRLDVQVLDDSTDETAVLLARKVEELRAEGFPIVRIHRTDRKGYKAGALAEALPQAQGEFVAIFDADFLPRPDFLEQTLSQFTDPSVGMVQTRWEYLNKDYSVLTRVQAFALDGHFIVEQQGRYAGGHFINFNGTAGVWRKACIDDAGGWQADTLTEDMDLSYRAQLRGWKFKYLESLGSPAELPVEMAALKSQQYRWTKGAAECARKHALRLLTARTVRWSDKVHSLAHLFYSATFIGLVLLAVLSIPVLTVKVFHPEYRAYFGWMSWLQVSALILALFYWISYKNASPQAEAGRFVVDYLVFLTVWMGLSLHNAIAVVEGYAGRKTPFVRTPKFAVVRKTDAWDQNQYISKKIPWLTWIEGLLALYFLGGLYLAWQWHDTSFVLFHSMLALGYGTVFWLSIRPAWKGLFVKRVPKRGLVPVRVG